MASVRRWARPSGAREVMETRRRSPRTTRARLATGGVQPCGRRSMIVDSAPGGRYLYLRGCVDSARISFEIAVERR